MKLTLRITPRDDAPYEVTTSMWTTVTFERRFKTSVSALASSPSMEHLAFLGYEASREAGITVPADFDSWLRHLDGLEVVGTEADRPTDPAAGAS